MFRPIWVLVAALAGCADSINHDKPDAGAPSDATATTGLTCTAGNVCTARASDGTYTTIVDSTSETAWMYVDFETGAKVTPTDAWDLRFQRFHISSNSGVSGTGGVAIAPIANTTFAQVTSPPATGYLVDNADGNGDNLPDYVFDQGDTWYDYNVTTHVLTPRANVYVVKTDGGSTLKLELTKYYDDAGTSGWFTLHWGPL